MSFLSSIFNGGGKYFDKKIAPKCDYCRLGKRAKDGNKVLCERKGLVDCNYSCSKFIYSPLKRIPVKQLNFVGSLADEDLYMESAGDRAEKEEETKAAEAASSKKDEKPAEKSSEAQKAVEKPADEAKAEDAPAAEKSEEAPKEEKAEEAAPEETPTEENSAE